jgi:hypothetical protein
LKKFLPIIIIVIIALAVGGYFVMGNKTASSSVTSKQTPGEAAVVTAGQGQQAQGQSFTGKLKDAILRNIPMKCTYKTQTDVATAYISGKNYYAEFSQDGKAGAIVIKDNCMYFWNKGEKTGGMMCFATTEDIWGKADERMADANLNCVPAVIPNSQFAIPSGVEFTDLDAMMKNLNVTVGASGETTGE